MYGDLTYQTLYASASNRLSAFGASANLIFIIGPSENDAEKRNKAVNIFFTGSCVNRMKVIILFCWYRVKALYKKIATRNQIMIKQN